MGQFLNYLSSVFSTNKLEATNKNNKQANHVTFADSSFSQAFTGKGDSERAAKLASVTLSNQKTISLFQFLVFATMLAHFSMVVWPVIRSDSFDLWEPVGWQFVTINSVPNFVYLSSIAAMMKVHKPITEGAKMSTKNADLDFSQNKLVQSLKAIVLLMLFVQLVSIQSHDFIWLAVVIIPVWSFILTARLARNEYERFSPSPKKQLFKLNISKSPKSPPPAKQTQTSPAKKLDNGQTPATPRTRTKRAVKNIINGVSDKYHAFEQNVAHQLSQKIFTPLSPKLKMIE